MINVQNILLELLKWSPGIIYPLSHIIQIVDMYKANLHNNHKKHPINIDLDMTTFLLFYIGNIGAYLFNKDYFSIPVWLAYIIPSILEIYILTYAKILDNETTKAIIYSIVLSVILVLLIIFAYIIFNDKQLSRKINKIGEYAGFFPALLFPLGILLQFIMIIKKQSFHLVSKNGWILMMIGNIGSYILTKQYSSWKSITAYILSAIFSLCIVIYISVKQNKQKKIDIDKNKDAQYN